MTKLHASKRVSLASSSGSLTKRNLSPIVINDADVDLANPEILTVQEDKDGDEDDDVDMDN